MADLHDPQAAPPAAAVWPRVALSWPSKLGSQVRVQYLDLFIRFLLCLFI